MEAYLHVGKDGSESIGAEIVHRPDHLGHKHSV